MGQQGDEDHHLLGLDPLSSQRIARVATYQPRQTHHRTRLGPTLFGDGSDFPVDLYPWTLWSLSRDSGWSTFLYLVFEAVSALATVGVTANVTSTLNGAGLGIIMVLMFIGRIGPLTLMVSLNNYKAKKADALQYAKADIIIG